LLSISTCLSSWASLFVPSAYPFMLMVKDKILSISALYFLGLNACWHDVWKRVVLYFVILGLGLSIW
jgi:hypothetical protein